MIDPTSSNVFDALPGPGHPRRTDDGVPLTVLDAEPDRPTADGSTYLAPGDACPDVADFAALSLVDLQALHSRICRQLDREYLEDPDGPDPVTLDRQQELVEELDGRERLLAAAGNVR